MPSSSGQWSARIMSSNLSNFLAGESIFPEDWERKDVEDLMRMIDEAFDKMYPKFEPQVIHTFGKDYFLPALKVLSIVNDEFCSPSKGGAWKDMELKAECVASPFPQIKHRMILKPDGNPEIEVYADEIFPPTHEAPNSDCDCGIYGSVNLEEIEGYVAVERERAKAFYTLTYNGTSLSSRSVSVTFALCIIEPSPDAKVILCRKGWKASHAFVSEILGETMDLHQASELLSIAWHRNLDLRSLS